ncbi:MAG: HAMP domain-containing sensor histidine kinase [Pseudomonadota bacterium]
MMTFGASVTGLLIFVYTSIISDMEEDLKHSIGIQVADMKRKFSVSGANDTIASIKNMLDKDEEKTLVLMLIDKNWNVLAGNLERWPGGKTNVEGKNNIDIWIKFPIANAVGGQLPPKAIAMNVGLQGGYILLVGRKMENIQHVHEIIVDVLYICFAVMFLLAAAGGMLLSYTIYRRIDIVNQTFRKVASGELNTRVNVIGIGDEFDHLAVNLNQTLNRICELIDGMRDISYNVAHDLRTPLNRLRNKLEAILASNEKGEKISDQVRASLTEIDSLVATFNAILRIAQAESGAGIEHFTEFNLSEAVIDVLDLYLLVAEDKSQVLISEITDNVMLKGDKHLITQMVANIVDNAIKYTERLGNIKVKLIDNGTYITLETADSGVGIPEKFYHKITEKFFRLEQSRSSPGNGLGLSLVSAAVKLHKGWLSFASNNPGLIVKITLPKIV